jgi:hypothetical protein
MDDRVVIDRFYGKITYTLLITPQNENLSQFSTTHIPTPQAVFTYLWPLRNLPYKLHDIVLIAEHPDVDSDVSTKLFLSKRMKRLTKWLCLRACFKLRFQLLQLTNEKEIV